MQLIDHVMLVLWLAIIIFAATNKITDALEHQTEVIEKCLKK